MAYCIKKMAKNVSKNKGRALEFGTNIGSAFVYKNFKEVLSTLPKLIKYYNTGEILYLGKFI